MIVDRKKEIGKKTFVSSKRVHHTLRHFYGLATFRFGERHFFFGPSFWSLMDWSFSGGSINQMMGVLSWAFIANCHCRPQLGWEPRKPGLIRKKRGHFCVNTNAYLIGMLRCSKSFHILQIRTKRKIISKLPFHIKTDVRTPYYHHRASGSGSLSQIIYHFDGERSIILFHRICSSIQKIWWNDQVTIMLSIGRAEREKATKCNGITIPHPMKFQPIWWRLEGRRRKKGWDGPELGELGWTNRFQNRYSTQIFQMQGHLIKIISICCGRFNKL